MTAAVGVLAAGQAAGQAGLSELVDAIGRRQEGLQGLLEAARRGDADAFAAIVRRFEGSTYHFVLRMVRRSATAEDIAQETFVRLWRHLDEVDSAEMLPGWLRRVAANAVIDHWRKEEARQRRMRMLREHPIARRLVKPSTRMESREALDAVQAALNSLPTKLRSVLVLRTMEALSYDELADILDISVHAVRSRLFRARQELLKRLEHASAADHLARMYGGAAADEDA